MKYAAGQTVMLGDKVSLGQDAGGVVVCIIDWGEYHPDHPETQWGYLKRGVIVCFPSCGPIYYQDELEPDMRLLTWSASNAQRT